MNTTIEPTEAEVVAGMIPGDRNDVYTARARIMQERSGQRLHPLQRMPATIEESPPFQTDPSDDDIRSEMRLLGRSYEHCKADLKRRLTADAKRLAAVIPSSAEQIARAQTDADEARRFADSILFESQSILDNLKSQILSLGALRKQIRCVRQLILDDDGRKDLAFKTLDFHLARQGGGDCVATQTGFTNTLHWLDNLTALQPFIADYIKPMEARADEMETAIRDAAAEQKVDLKKFLALLASERGQRPGESLDYAVEIYDGLI